MNNTTMRKLRSLARLLQTLGEIRLERWNLQCQYYNLIAPSDEETRISGEIYSLRINLGEISESECPF
jgi:hypothetical protein